MINNEICFKQSEYQQLHELFRSRELMHRQVGEVWGSVSKCEWCGAVWGVVGMDGCRELMHRQVGEVWDGVRQVGAESLRITASTLWRVHVTLIS